VLGARVWLSMTATVGNSVEMTPPPSFPGPGASCRFKVSTNVGGGVLMDGGASGSSVGMKVFFIPPDSDGALVVASGLPVLLPLLLPVSFFSVLED